MSLRVHKHVIDPFEVDENGEFNLTAQLPAKILSVEGQGDKIVIFTLGDSLQFAHTRKLYLVRTGDSLPNDLGGDDCDITFHGTAIFQYALPYKVEFHIFSKRSPLDN